MHKNRNGTGQILHIGADMKIVKSSVEIRLIRLTRVLFPFNI